MAARRGVIKNVAKVGIPSASTTPIRDRTFDCQKTNFNSPNFPNSEKRCTYFPWANTTIRRIRRAAAAAAATALPIIYRYVVQ